MEQAYEWWVVVDRYIASADIWHFSNIGIDQYGFLFNWSFLDRTFILMVLTFSLLVAVVVNRSV